jgi:YebC/PmpR family DNA-binding regulatory protein
VSGHSKWATIKRKKGAADAKRGRVFTKIIREITVAARQGGTDPESNPRLRLALQNAKAANMPSKNIDSAIAKGSGKLDGGVSFDEAVYEGYGPGGVALLIDVVTDNRNRTVSELRYILSKNNGNLGEGGSVAWMFETRGMIVVGRDKIGEEELMELVLDAGAEDMETTDDAYEIKALPENFEKVRQALEQKGVPMVSAEISKVPKNTIKVDGENAGKVLRLMETIEDQDDVQHVYSNFDIDEKEMEKLAR